MSWTEKTQQGETWSNTSQQSETWSATSEQGETWASLAPSLRVFDPHVFDRFPVFDTGSSLAGVWDDKVQQPEVWT